ncbi:MAG TPA: DegT/DnrJ/EryC1/StrS family aminotransferase [Terriglobales bacterium]|nr:DegT/DnrJ/EryC1/StrS family aminotransferase [Terriglobales bacterium]
MSLRIPLAKPEVTDADREAVLDVLRSPSLSMGPKLDEFEKAISIYTGSKFAVAVNSGTSALHLALKTLDLSPGGEVILPSFTFVAPLNVLLQEKLQPVFVDIDSRTINVTPEIIEAAITTETKAIIAIHTFGRPVAMDQLRAIADRHGIFLIEDACEALGAEVVEKKVGSFGDVGILAFYPNKQITTGEGGMFLTSNKELADHARRLRNQGRDPSLDWYQQAEKGYSYRLSDINCALGIEQLRRIESIINRRQALTLLYEERLAGCDGILTPALEVAEGKISWFTYVIQLTKNFDRNDRDWICDRLISHGIGAGRYFAPLHRQPVLKNFAPQPNLPVTDHVADRVIALPFFNQMTKAEIHEVCDTLTASLDELRRRKT